MATKIQDLTQEQAIEAGQICGGLIFGYLWNLQNDFAMPASVPMRRKVSDKKYLTAKEAAELMGIGRSKFYEIKDDDDFPKKHTVAGGLRKYLAAEIQRYNSKQKKA